MNRSAALQDACFERILQKIDSNKYYCVMCKMHFTGESPTISHLLTTKHSESLAKEAVGIYTGATISQIRLDVLLKKIPDEITIGITKRVITLKNGLFWCDSCQKSFTGTQPVLEHLSSKHSTMTAPIEIGQQIADATPENYSTMVDTDLTSSIYKGQIVQDEENYNCIICRKFLAGKEQAKQHIAGKSHQKKLKNRLDQPVQKAPGARDLPPQPVVVTPPSNKADAKFQQQVADSTPENYSTMEDIELTRSMNARQVVQDGEMYNCIVCTKSLTGKEPAKQHIAGKSHQKKLKSRLDQSIQNVPDGRDLTPQLAVATPLSDQVDNIQQQVADSTPENYSTMEDIELTRSMNARQVVQDGEMYNCIVCTKSLTGKEPAKQHIAGKSHQKKLKSRLDQSIQNVPDGRDLTPQLAVATPLSDQVDNIGKIPRHKACDVIPATTPIQPDKDTYKNTSRPRGLVCIFNYNVFTGNPSLKRDGSENDVMFLNTLFGKMGYIVQEYLDLTKEKTEAAISEICQQDLLKHVDSFVLILMSHGEANNDFLTADSRMINIEFIRFHFSDKDCPSLAGKPKIILANFCRGTYQESLSSKDRTTDGVETRETPKDMITINASFNTIKAVRIRNCGTIFAIAICEVLSQHSHSHDLTQLYRKLCDTMMKYEGTTPDILNYRFIRKFYFNPMTH
ncbi:uncharacterized protein LOC143040582 isoform X3 [Oratosquilla oratoria]|uniref:uncharacterized protein LOC143040582 isoform X3 n=1 Tax=Oratosquilla oratoria TaxID=337810 RepID=UPI003F7726AD